MFKNVMVSFKHRSVIQFLFIQTHETLLSGTQFVQTEVFFSSKECLKINLSFPPLSLAFKYRQASFLVTLFWRSAPSTVPSGAAHMHNSQPYPPNLLAMARPLIQRQSTGTSQPALTSVARFLSQEIKGLTHEKSCKSKQKKPVHRKRTNQGPPSSP